MKNVIAVLGMVMAVNPVWSAASEAPMPFELGRTGIEAVRLTGVSVPAPVMKAVEPAQLQAAETAYVRKNLFIKLDSMVRYLMLQEGVGENLTPAGSAGIYRRAVAALKKEKDPSAPSRAAFDTMIYVAERITWIYDAAAGQTDEIVEYLRIAGGPLERIKGSVMNAGSLALMRSDAEIITSQFLNNGAKAARDAWKHAALRAGDGTDIGVDYSIVNLGGSVIAAPVWISVTNPAFRGGERVKAVLLNYHEGGSAPLIQQTREIDLKYSGNGRYTAEAGKVPLSESHIGYGYNFRQEIAVAVDGKWLKDPVSGSSNFRFKMTRY